MAGDKTWMMQIRINRLIGDLKQVRLWHGIPTFTSGGVCNLCTLRAEGFDFSLKKDVRILSEEDAMRAALGK